MHQQLISQYTDIMASLDNLPGEIAAAQTDLNAAKAQLADNEKALAAIESDLSLTVEGKNAEERKAKLSQALRTDLAYTVKEKAIAADRMEVAKLTTEYDRLSREFAAVGYAARLTASMAEMLAAMGPNKAQDVQFNMDASGKSAAVLTGSNGHMTAQDAADLGL